MKQYHFENNQLVLKIKETPLIIRLCIYLVTFLCFALPLMGIFLTIIYDGELKFTILIVLGISSLIGFYLLRVSLWNTFGKEIIEFKQNEITYTADYHWFKDKLKSIKNSEIHVSILDVGYEEDNLGTLSFQNKNLDEIISVIKLPKNELEKLIIQIGNEQTQLDKR